MNVLIIHQHFKSPYQGGAIRSYYLAKALVDAGHEVNVITGNVGDKKTFEIDGVNVHSLRVSYENQFGFFKRSYSFLKFVASSIGQSSLYRKADIVYAISVPLTVGVIAMWIKRWYRVPYIFEVGDLWPEAPIQMGFVKHSLLKSVLFKLEKTIYEKSICVIALSPAIKESIDSKIKEKEVYLIPNMADTCFYKPTEKSDLLKNKFDVENEFVISYIGTMGLANGLEYLVECAALCQARQLSVKFFLCGEGAVLSQLQLKAEKMQLKNLTFISFQTRDGVKELMNVSDAVFVSYKPLPVLETGSPNKYFDGLASGKLIIINFGGWIKKEIEQNQCGISVNPFDPSDFAKKIQPFLSDNNLLASYQCSSRALAEKLYSRKILSERFVSVVSQQQ